MIVASYNINGINGRLQVLLRWLAERQPDVVCLQELKSPDERFPEGALRELGYDAVWHGQKAWNGVAILSRVGEVCETRRGLPGDPDDSHSRYIEAAVGGILIGNLYLPNGNPRPGPKFDYKLKWFERLIAHAEGLLASGLPVMLAGDFNVMPTERDVYAPERWLDDALFAPEARAAWFRLIEQGWVDAVRQVHRDAIVYTFWKYFRDALRAERGPEDRPLPAQPAARRAPCRCRSRPRGARLGEDQRSRAGMDRVRRAEAPPEADERQDGALRKCFKLWTASERRSSLLPCSVSSWRA